MKFLRVVTFEFKAQTLNAINRRKEVKAEQIWQAALGELELQMTKPAFNTWLRNTSCISYEDGTFTIGVANAYTKDWLENRLLGLIKRTLIGIVGRSVEVKFAVWSRKREERVSLLPISSQAGTTIFNPKYTFKTFVVGPSNRLAFAASESVAKNPTTSYNPLFLYGGVGLGKTHLLHAVGHECQRKGLRVLYVSSERFINDLINSISNHTTEEFREKYRRSDVLLVDDIQFIAGKESTQEEFFHTFNTLYQANKRIVISSDRSPKALITLEERLRSRFEWGLIADIQPPELETRIAILRYKARSHPITVPNDVIDLIAYKITNNIRELEGALNRVVAYANLLKRPLTVEMAALALQEFISRPDPPTLEEVIEGVARFYNLKAEDLRSPRRKKELVLPRQMAIYLAREESGISLQKIGEALGGRAHSTILHGYEKMLELIRRDEELRKEMMLIKEKLYNL
jgi:chromosomal replication initiator protein